MSLSNFDENFWNLVLHVEHHYVSLPTRYLALHTMGNASDRLTMGISLFYVRYLVSSQNDSFLFLAWLNVVGCLKAASNSCVGLP